MIGKLKNTGSILLIVIVTAINHLLFPVFTNSQSFCGPLRLLNPVPDKPKPNSLIQS
jgi:hypothetical protein